MMSLNALANHEERELELPSFSSFAYVPGRIFGEWVYTDLLANRGAAISMAAVGKPEENGFAERFTRTIREEIDLSEYRDFADAYGRPGRLLDDVYKHC
jgi:hypothetical protein